jgi:positive regulator of sigma E activity
LKESGKVIRNIDQGRAIVEVHSSAACANCGACRFNDSGILSMEAENGIGARAGETVEVEIPEGRVVLSSLMIFIFPIFAFFLGYLIKGIISGAVCLAVYLVFLYHFDKRTKTMPKITRVLSSS